MYKIHIVLEGKFIIKIFTPFFDSECGVLSLSSLFIDMFVWKTEFPAGFPIEL